MKTPKIIKLHGNLNRITELNDAGYSATTIASMFQDHEIQVTALQVSAIIDALPALSAKALPKRVVRAAVNFGREAATATS